MRTGYTNEQLSNMSYEELCRVKPKDMIEHPPVLGLGFPYTVSYACKFCGQRLEGSERRVSNPHKAKIVFCPYCNKILWDPEGRNCLRKSAFKPGHFELERRKRFLKHLKDRAKNDAEF